MEAQIESIPERGLRLYLMFLCSFPFTVSNIWWSWPVRCQRSWIKHKKCQQQLHGMEPL